MNLAWQNIIHDRGRFSVTVLGGCFAVFCRILESGGREMAAGVPGVTETGRVCMAFAVYRTPNGTQQVVALVGADPNVGKRFPVPNAPESAGETSPEAVLYDVSDRKQMEVSSLPA